jgi:serine/threonine protein kinase
LQNKTQLFALKEFKERKKENEENKTFSRELKCLKELKGFPHPHIVTHLFTWTQNERFYMLFPMARFNLAEYMRIQPAESPHDNSPTSSFVHMRRDLYVRRPVLEPSFVTWLLTQLKGLGEAVKHIHHLMGDAVKLPKLDPSDRNIGRVRATGYHHDIKPDNILVFIDGRDQYGTLKISDFGSGRLQTLRSGTQWSVFANTPLGTSTYEGPDFYLKGKASRPLDLWSLGCVFLEILLWCFIPGKGGAENFSTHRLEASQIQPNVSTDNFWYPIITEGRIKDAALKDAVVKRLETLREDHCKGRRAFTRLLKLIEQMFETDPDKRIKATDLADALEAILKQARQDVQAKPNCYIEGTFENLPESAVPIPTTPTTVPSRPPSLGELNTIFGETLSPRHAESPTFHRRRSDSIGRAAVASMTSNAGGHLSQSDRVQDDGLADPLTEKSPTPTTRNFVRPWQGNDDFGPSLSRPQPPQRL